MATPNLGRDTHFGTYRVAGFPAVDFDEFHRVELPSPGARPTARTAPRIRGHCRTLGAPPSADRKFKGPFHTSTCMMSTQEGKSGISMAGRGP